MAEQDHVVGRLTVAAAATDEGTARNMLARIEAFWRDAAPPLMARVFDELAPADRHVRLERLDLDLGRLPAAGFEAAALTALERALRDVLPGAVAGEGRSLSSDEAALELLEHYLARGTVPFWARATTPDVPAALAALAARQPALLIGVLRRIARDRAALERLALRLGEEDLRRLLALLSPADAALILAYLADVIVVHRTRPLAPVEEPALRRAMWVLTLEYLLREAGTQFNRRSFLASLLGGLAEREDVDYGTLLVLLRDALAQTSRRLTLQSSLPATLLELLAEEDLPAEPGEAPEDFASELARLPPSEAAAVDRTIETLVSWHRAAGLLPLSETALRQRLQAAVRRHLARPFVESAFMAEVLRDLAASEGVSFGDLAGSVAAQAPRGTQDTILATLASEARGGAEGTRRATQDDDALDELEALLRHGEGERARLASLIAQHAAQSPIALAALIRRLARARATLFRVVTMLAEESLQTLLRVLVAEHAGEVAAYLETLRAAHRSEPLLPVGEERFAQITWTLALDYVAREPGSQFNRRSLLRSLIEGIARHDGIETSVVIAALSRGLEALAARRTPVGSMPAVLAELLAEGAPSEKTATAALQRAALALRGEAVSVDAPLWTELARREPAALAALLRRIANEDEAAWPERLERLLQWLAPQEIAALFAAGSEAAAGRAADASSWMSTLTALARGEALPEPMAPGARWDREALLAHWLEHDALPDWTPGAMQTGALGEMLEALPLPSLQALFFVPDETRRIALLRRALRLLGETRGSALLRRLIPTSGERAAALTAALQARDSETQRVMLLRAAAAGVAGKPLDLEALPPLDQQAQEPAARRRAMTAAARRADRADLLDWIKGTREPAAGEVASLVAGIAELADRDDAALRDIVQAAWRDPAVRRRWIAALPDRMLARILNIVAPGEAHFLLEAARMLTTARRQITPQAPAALPWAAMFDLLAGSTGRDVRALSRGLVTHLAGEDVTARTALLTRAHALARDGGAVQLVAILQPPRPPRRAPAARAWERRKPGDGAEETPGEPLYVRNAGLVLFAPYLPRLFEQMDVLRPGPDGKPRISGVEAASRAVHLLQYLVTERCDTPEPELVLNKLLCGLDLALPIAPSIEPTQAEREMCDSLVQAVIANWPSIKGTSPAGLRETFLQREGKITRQAGDWQLRVQRRTVDVLVDQIPWGFSVILHRWMEHPIHVTW